MYGELKLTKSFNWTHIDFPSRQFFAKLHFSQSLPMYAVNGSNSQTYRACAQCTMTSLVFVHIDLGFGHSGLHGHSGSKSQIPTNMGPQTVPSIVGSKSSAVRLLPLHLQSMCKSCMLPSARPSSNNTKHARALPASRILGG